jgi:hypothetical protein
VPPPRTARWGASRPSGWPPREAGQDRRQDRASWALRRLPAGRGGSAPRLVRRDPAPDRSAQAEATPDMMVRPSTLASPRQMCARQALVGAWAPPPHLRHALGRPASRVSGRNWVVAKLPLEHDALGESPSRECQITGVTLPALVAVRPAGILWTGLADRSTPK